MTIKELKEFIKDCNDDDYVTICSHGDDNPITDYCDVSVAYRITASDNRDNQICLMPM